MKRARDEKGVEAEAKAKVEAEVEKKEVVEVEVEVEVEVDAEVEVVDRGGREWQGRARSAADSPERCGLGRHEWSGKSDDESTPSAEYEVERITAERTSRRGVEYRIKWKGYPDGEATWEPEAALSNASESWLAWQEEKTAQVERGRGMSPPPLEQPVEASAPGELGGAGCSKCRFRQDGCYQSCYDARKRCKKRA